MKKGLLLFVMLILFLSPCLIFGQEASSPGNAITVDPIWLLLNTYKGGFERRVTDQISGQVKIAYSPDFLWGLHGYERLTYLDIVVQGRFYVGSLFKEQAKDVNIGSASTYLSKIFTDALGGLYAGAFVGYVNSVVVDGEGPDYYKAVFNGAGGGLELGLKYIFGNRKVSFFIEPYGLMQFYGGGYTYFDENGNDSVKPNGFDDGFGRDIFSGGFNIGLTF